MFDRLDDTIVAISSPAGAGVRGIIRLSGPEAFRIAGTVFAGWAPPTQCDDSQDAHPTRIQDCIRFEGGGTIPAEAYVFRAPGSYTRQDVIELHMLGSPPLLAQLLEQLARAGARPAEPGEFTARAYFNGALDLTRVEGVAAAIHAQTDAQLRASEALLHGELSRRTHQLRESLVDLLALVEAQIDFVDEPIEFVAPAEMVATMKSVADDLTALMAGAPEIERLEVLPEILLVGPPNAGKSTFFNRLTGLDRAIRSATAGTTRDVLRAPLTLTGGEVMLSDTAGLENAEHDHGVGDTAQEGDSPHLRNARGRALAFPKWGQSPAVLAQDAARRAIRSADVILLLLDAAEPAPAASLYPALPAARTRIVLNKMDVVAIEPAREALREMGITTPVFAISALTGEGIEPLRREISAALFGGVQTCGAELLALTHRQRACLEDASAALRRALRMTSQTQAISSCWELIALELRAAISALSLLTGEVSSEELLTRIFSRFCIGK